LLFGKGKVSDLMGDVAKGIKSFKKGLAEEETPTSPTPPATTPAKAVEHETARTETKSPAGTETKA
jgi:sec-independent protein translocase protein TatA